MSAVSNPRQLILGVSALLVSGVALSVAIGVIPPVRAGRVPNITSESAAPAFWVVVGLHLLAAVILLVVRTISKQRSRGATRVLGVTAMVILLAGLALGDAAKAPLEIGAPLQLVTTILLGCVAADALAGVLTIAAAFMRPAQA